MDIQRIQKDIKELQKTPLIDASAFYQQDDVSLWHCNILVPLTIKDKLEKVPIHFLMELPESYPKNPPSVGFLCSFPYNMGATKYITNGRLKDLFTLCLNILGNFMGVHTEWSEVKGEGWSPAMTISSVILNLQSILMDLNDKNGMLQSDKDKLYLSLKESNCKSCGHQGTNPYPKIFSFNEIQQEKELNQIRKNLDKELIEKIENIQIKYSFNNDCFKEICELVHQVIKSNPQQQQQLVQQEESKESQEQNKEQQFIEEQSENILCYVSGVSFREELLGYGVYKDRNLLSTPGELISLKEFNNGIRQSSSKIAFQFFLPAFITPKHSIESQNWVKTLHQSMIQIAQSIEATNQEAPIQVLSRIMSSQIVEMKKSQKAQAILFFECICSVWRTLYHVIQSDKILKDLAFQMVKAFTYDENERHKNKIPDLGVFLALYTVVCDKINFQDFVDALIDENFIRCVMWWMGNIRETADEVFQATQISREILLFQITLVREVIGSEPSQAAKQMDATYCRLPKTLESFQQKIKKIQINNWSEYFQILGASDKFRQKIESDLNGWVQDCIKRSYAKGPKYQKNNGGSGNRGGRGRGRGR